MSDEFPKDMEAEATDINALKSVFGKLGIAFDEQHETKLVQVCINPNAAPPAYNKIEIAATLAVKSASGHSGFCTLYYFDSAGKYVDHAIRFTGTTYKETL